MAKTRWRPLPKEMSAIAFNPRDPKKLEPLRLHCRRCGSSAFYVIKEKRPYKHKTLSANRKRHSVICVSCWKDAKHLSA